MLSASPEKDPTEQLLQVVLPKESMTLNRPAEQLVQAMDASSVEKVPPLHNTQVVAPWLGCAEPAAQGSQPELLEVGAKKPASQSVQFINVELKVDPGGHPMSHSLKLDAPNAKVVVSVGHMEQEMDALSSS